MTKVDFLVDKALSLNIFELRYFSMQLRDRIQRSTGMNPIKINMDWPSVTQDLDGTWPPMNPNWFKQQELMSQLGPFMGGFSGGGGQGMGGGEQADEAVKEEKKVEKTNFDIELTSFEPRSKIKIIKEVRVLLSLGLKEAKDLVESAPVWIKKEVKKEPVNRL